MLHSIHNRLVNKSIAELKKNHFTAHCCRLRSKIFRDIFIGWVCSNIVGDIILTFDYYPLDLKSPYSYNFQHSFTLKSETNPKQINTNWFLTASILKRYENDLVLSTKGRLLYWEYTSYSSENSNIVVALRASVFPFLFIPFAFDIKNMNKKSDFNE